MAESSSDGEGLRGREQVLRVSSRHSWFLQQLARRIEHAVELGDHIHSKQVAGEQEQEVLQPGDTGTVHSASEVEEAASVEAASELVAAHMVRRTDEQAAVSTGAVREELAVPQRVGQ
jgi:hypothetical protein